MDSKNKAKTERLITFDSNDGQESKKINSFLILGNGFDISNKLKSTFSQWIEEEEEIKNNNLTDSIKFFIDEFLNNNTGSNFLREYTIGKVYDKLRSKVGFEENFFDKIEENYFLIYLLAIKYLNPERIENIFKNNDEDDISSIYNINETELYVQNWSDIESNIFLFLKETFLFKKNYQKINDSDYFYEIIKKETDKIDIPVTKISPLSNTRGNFDYVDLEKLDVNIGKKIFVIYMQKYYEELLEINDNSKNKLSPYLFLTYLIIYSLKLLLNINLHLNFLFKENKSEKEIDRYNNYEQNFSSPGDFRITMNYISRRPLQSNKYKHDYSINSNSSLYFENQIELYQLKYLENSFSKYLYEQMKGNK